jgi:hypothetical protein
MKTEDRQLENEKIKKLKKEREYLSTGEMKKETKNKCRKCTQDDLYGVYMSNSELIVNFEPHYTIHYYLSPSAGR